MPTTTGRFGVRVPPMQPLEPFVRHRSYTEAASSRCICKAQTASVMVTGPMSIPALKTEMTMESQQVERHAVRNRSAGGACLVAGCPCKDARIVSHRRAAFFAAWARDHGETADRVISPDASWRPDAPEQSAV